jgi:hypothetical protein
MGTSNASKAEGQETPKKLGFPRLFQGKMKKAPPGFEPGMADLQSGIKAAQSLSLTDTCGDGDSRFARGFAQSDQNQPTDRGLARLVEAWPLLPADVQAAILALVDDTHH